MFLRKKKGKYLILSTSIIDFREFRTKTLFIIYSLNVCMEYIYIRFEEILRMEKVIFIVIFTSQSLVSSFSILFSRREGVDRKRKMIFISYCTFVDRNFKGVEISSE